MQSVERKEKASKSWTQPWSARTILNGRLEEKYCGQNMPSNQCCTFGISVAYFAAQKKPPPQRFTSKTTTHQSFRDLFMVCTLGKQRK